jgi:hypothetical protein
MRLKEVIQAAVISTFTIAAALIWKDVIIEFIELFVLPPSGRLFYKFLVAICATVVIVIFISVFLETEHEAESVMIRFKRKNHKKK